MKKNGVWLLAAWALSCMLSKRSEAHVAQAHIADQIDTRRGSNSHVDYSRGNTFAATCVPFGFNMWTPVTEPDSHRWLYVWDHPQLFGLGLTHQASPWMKDYGTLQILPSITVPQADVTLRGAAFSHDHESAKPYRYAVTLDNGIKISVVPTSHAAHLTFTYPQAHNAYLTFDDISNTLGELRVDPVKKTVSGSTITRDYAHTPREMFIYGKFQQAEIHGVSRLANRHLGLYVELTPTQANTVHLLIGTSWIDIQQAQQNLEQEVETQNLAALTAAGQLAWDEALGQIRIEGGSAIEQRIFYNNLYRTLIYPNALAEGDAPHYRSPYDGQVHAGETFINNGFWDTYRAVWPLHVLLRPTQTGVMLNGFVNAYKEGGWTPRWSAPGYNEMMVGTHTDAVFADAYVKGVRGFDVDGAYASAVKNATVVSPYQDRGRPANHRTPYLGWLPDELHAESAAWHLEDCINDYAIGSWAHALGRLDDVAYFQHRARQYGQLYSPSVGFFRGRRANGSWRTGDAEFSPITWGFEFTEGNPWHYIVPAPFDAQGTAFLYGGTTSLGAKLDALFSAERGFRVGSYGHTIHEMSEAYEGAIGQYAHANEPVHHLAWMYNFVGRPAAAQKQLRRILDPNQGLYTLGVDNGGGYLGDEDNGQMSAWYVFASMGLYPASPGIAEYYIGSPVFSSAKIAFENGKVFAIQAKFNSATNVYVQNALLNGRPYNKSYLPHDVVVAGGSLVLTMGPQPSAWANDPNASTGCQNLGMGGRVHTGDVSAKLTLSVSAGDAKAGSSSALLVDDDATTVWQAAHSSVTLGLTCSAEQPALIVQYTLTSGGKDSRCDPTSWQLAGSDDGHHWELLDSRHHQAFSWRYQVRGFDLPQPTAHRYLRWRLNAEAGANCLEVAEIEFLADMDGRR